jgi:type II secretory pathway component GspD/PulD (secretin)
MKMKKRLLTVLCLSASLLWQSAGYAQEVTLARHDEKASERTSLVRKHLKDVIQDLKKRFDVDFIYENDILEGKKVTYVPQKNEHIEYVLEHVLASANLKYKKIDQKVYAIIPQTIERKTTNRLVQGEVSATEKQEKLLAPIMELHNFNRKFILTRLERRISGKVTSSEDGQPLPG